MYTGKVEAKARLWAVAQNLKRGGREIRRRILICVHHSSIKFRDLVCTKKNVNIFFSRAYLSQDINSASKLHSQDFTSP
jgi:hypothetical protein